MTIHGRDLDLETTSTRKHFNKKRIKGKRTKSIAQLCCHPKYDAYRQSQREEASTSLDWNLPSDPNFRFVSFTIDLLFLTTQKEAPLVFRRFANVCRKPEADF